MDSPAETARAGVFANHPNAVPPIRKGACPMIGQAPFPCAARPCRPARAPGFFCRYFFLAALSSLESTAMKASCGTSTEPTIFIRFLPSFCFSSSFRLREMSPP